MFFGSDLIKYYDIQSAFVLPHGVHRYVYGVKWIQSPNAFTYFSVALSLLTVPSSSRTLKSLQVKEGVEVRESVINLHAHKRVYVIGLQSLVGGREWIIKATLSYVLCTYDCDDDNGDGDDGEDGNGDGDDGNDGDIGDDGSCGSSNGDVRVMMVVVMAAVLMMVMVMMVMVVMMVVMMVMMVTLEMMVVVAVVMVMVMVMSR